MRAPGPDVLADLELSLQALTEDRRVSTLDGIHDLLRRLGDLDDAEVAARTEGVASAAGPWLLELERARRAVRIRIAGEERWVAVEDVARYRDACGVSVPMGIPAEAPRRPSGRWTRSWLASPGRTGPS